MAKIFIVRSRRKVVDQRLKIEEEPNVSRWRGSDVNDPVDNYRNSPKHCFMITDQTLV